MWPGSTRCGSRRSTGANRPDSGRSAEVEREPVSSPRRRRAVHRYESHACENNAARPSPSRFLCAGAVSSRRASRHGRRQRSRHATAGTPATPSTKAQIATWFGPGFYGQKTACGQTMSPVIVGVASRTLPCGTLVLVNYKGHRLTVPVIDRGPYAKRRHLGSDLGRGERTDDHRNGARQDKGCGPGTEHSPAGRARRSAADARSGGQRRHSRRLSELAAHATEPLGISLPAARRELDLSRRLSWRRRIGVGDRAPRGPRGVDAEIGASGQGGRLGAVVGADGYADRDLHRDAAMGGGGAHQPRQALREHRAPVPFVSGATSQ